ncbi:hypothetical protein C8J56DRAFT_1168088 [Mycena floridula]|nr:hypothetical protein C8J56DRAFT_1168088 [Mycena floridula]
MKRGFLLKAQAKKSKPESTKQNHSITADADKLEDKIADKGEYCLAKYGVVKDAGSAPYDHRNPGSECEIGPPPGYVPLPVIDPRERTGEEKWNPDDDIDVITRMPPPEHPNLPELDQAFTECLITGWTKKAALRYPGFPSAVPRPSKPAHRIAKTPRKGLAVFATRKLAAGELLFAERPLIIMPSALPVHGPNLTGYSRDQIQQIALQDTERILEVMVGRMDEEDKAKVMALHNSHTKDGSGPLMGRFRTNAFGGVKELQHKGLSNYESGIICNEGSRFNHSCSPNVQFKWDPASFSMKFLVLRAVEAGEEITYSYSSCGITPPAAERQKALEPYEFRCTCAACLHPEISDPRRQSLENAFMDHKIDNEANAWVNNLTLSDDHMVLILKHHLDVCELKGLQASVEYQECCTWLTTCYAWLADEENCMKYARMVAVSEGQDPDKVDVAKYKRDGLTWGLRLKSKTMQKQLAQTLDALKKLNASRA